MLYGWILGEIILIIVYLIVGQMSSAAEEEEEPRIILPYYHIRQMVAYAIGLMVLVMPFFDNDKVVLILCIGISIYWFVQSYFNKIEIDYWRDLIESQNDENSEDNQNQEN